MDYQRRPRYRIPLDVGHDSGKWGTIPLHLQKCPTSQRNAAPHRSGTLPHFKWNQCPTSTGIRSWRLGDLRGHTMQPRRLHVPDLYGRLPYDRSRLGSGRQWGANRSQQRILILPVWRWRCAGGLNGRQRFPASIDFCPSRSLLPCAAPLLVPEGPLLFPERLESPARDAHDRNASATRSFGINAKGDIVGLCSSGGVVPGFLRSAIAS